MINRNEVYAKYDGHCAYCGAPITLKTMQVDHIISKRQFPYKNLDYKVDDIENLNPSCRRCNHYKRANGLELFRELLKTLHSRLDKIYIYKVAKDYGIVIENPWDGLFYFERIKL